jgi:PAS domain S-box-containing protein
MSKINLLFLEDEEMDVFLIRKVLERSGLPFELSTASTKGEFIDALDKDKYDVILADHSLPQFSAIEALHITKERNISKPFILVTGTVSEDFAIRAMKDGAWDYILKDRLQRLPAAITGALEKYHLELEKQNFLSELISRQNLLNEGEKMGHFGSWRHDRLKNIIVWSDELFRILGYEPGSIAASAENFLQRVHPEDAARVSNLLNWTKQHPDRECYECRIITTEGGIRHVYAEQAITRNNEGENILLNGFICDITTKKEAEFKTTESERKYRDLFENNPMPMWVLDTETFHFLDVNKAAIRHYGYSYDEFMSMTGMDIRPEEEKEKFKSLDRSGTRGFNNNGLWKHVKKDGTVILVDISTDLIVFEGINARLVLINDVTEKIEAENKLKLSETRLKASQRIAHIGGWELSLENNRNNLRWSDETFHIFGLEPGQEHVTLGYFFSRLHPDDVELVHASLDNATENNREYNVEHRIIRADGAVRVVHERGEIIYDHESGAIIGIEGTIQDITDRKNDEELLQKSEANLRTLFNNTDSGYVLLDTDLNIVSFNTPVNEFAKTELHKNIVAGTPAIEYFSEEKRLDIQQCFINALAGTSTNYEVSYPQPDGTDKWYYCSYHSVWSADQKMLGVLMAITDITERKLSELQEKIITADLLQRNNDLEQFAYIISHNLRSPVANIIGISNALLEGNMDEHETREFMSGLSTSIHKLDSVIVDLNNILQVKHKLNQHKEKVLLSQIVSDVKYSLSNFTGSDMVMIATDFSGIDELSTLKSYIYSIFYNLISNSIKYRQPGKTPEINIKSCRHGDKIEIRFKDNSMGIDLEKKGDQLFGLYKRFHQQYAEGKGIGLFMVKTQVETLGGKIAVKSKVNEGTEFIIEFDSASLLN